MADGLDANWIVALFQNEMGELYAGSRGGERGLNYYDGMRWGAPPIPPLPVDYPNVQVMVGNEAEGYFVGLEDQGLASFDGEEWTVLTSADGLPAGGVLDALLTDDSLWVSYEEAVVRFDLADGRLGDPAAGVYPYDTRGGRRRDVVRRHLARRALRSGYG